MIETGVAVIGGGASGLAAAIASATAGASTVLFDEAAAAGGELRYRLGEVAVDERRRFAGPQATRALLDDAYAAGVEVHAATTVFGVWPSFEVGLRREAGPARIRAQRVIVATGATDLPAIFPGGSLPGVITWSGLLRLLHVHRVLPGQRFVLVGDGAEVAEAAEAIDLAGGAVVRRVPLALRRELVAYGARGIERVTVGGEAVAADCVVVCAGRMPDVAAPMMLETPTGYSATLGGFVAARNEVGETLTPGLFVCGNAAGVTDPATAIAEGTVAGLAAAMSLGAATGVQVAEAVARVRALAPGRIEAQTAVQPAWVQHFVHSVAATAGER
jgi:sarcosine oxidase subunit alpha